MDLRVILTSLAILAVVWRTESLVTSSWSRHRTALYDKPAFTFGVCADIQYVDAPDDYNFQKTKVRRYLQSLDIFKEAVESWAGMAEQPAFAILLGDIVDGKTNQLKNQDKCLQDLMDVCKSWDQSKFQHVFGNHEFYAFSREEIHQKVLMGREDCSQEKLYYAFMENKWKFICLDGYDSSLIGASSPETLELAQALLKKKNPNDLNGSGGWFDNLPREDYRFVPYNGGLGPDQIQWLRDQLTKSSNKQENVAIFCHQPIHAPTKPQSLLWNAEEVKEIIRECGQGCVKLWMAGHDHDGNYNAESVGDPEGNIIHHVVPPAPIECQEGGTAFGHVEVYNDRLTLNWTGRKPHAKNGIIWPTDMYFKEGGRGVPP